VVAVVLSDCEMSINSTLLLGSLPLSGLFGKYGTCFLPVNRTQKTDAELAATTSQQDTKKSHKRHNSNNRIESKH
jgi:hypothetical protein